MNQRQPYQPRPLLTHRGAGIAKSGIPVPADGKTRYAALGRPELRHEASEWYYSASLEIAQVGYYLIQQIFPRSVRERNRTARESYESAHEIIKGHHTRYKTTVRDHVLAEKTVRLTRHAMPYDFTLSDFGFEVEDKTVKQIQPTSTFQDRPTFQLRSMLVRTYLYLLTDNLATYAHMVIPPSVKDRADVIVNYQTTLWETYRKQAVTLLDTLSLVEAFPTVESEHSPVYL